VLLIDADLRRPSIGDMATVNGSGGLSEALKARAETKLTLVPLTPMLSLLPSGRPDPDPIGGLTSLRMRQILEEASARFDWVILDAPPLEPLADAGLLAEMVDGTVFVVRAGTTQYPAVRRAVDALGSDRVFGVVLNGVAARDVEGQGHYYGYGGAGTHLE
jgi:Mrp family chromosome partitioning ATPase